MNGRRMRLWTDGSVDIDGEFEYPMNGDNAVLKQGSFGCEWLSKSEGNSVV